MVPVDQKCRFCQAKEKPALNLLNLRHSTPPLVAFRQLMMGAAVTHVSLKQHAHRICDSELCLDNVLIINLCLGRATVGGCSHTNACEQFLSCCAVCADRMKFSISSRKYLPLKTLPLSEALSRMGVLLGHS